MLQYGKKRNQKDKNENYSIRKPALWNNIPKETWQFLNEKIKCSELEIKLYLWCFLNWNTGTFNRVVTLEDIRDGLGTRDTGGNINNKIRKALSLLSQLGLLNFQEQEGSNSRGIKIPNYLIKNVNVDLDKCYLAMSLDS